MPTCRQLALHGREKRRRRCIVAALYGAPQRKGVVINMGFTTPKKPNSAKRKFIKVRIIISKKLIFAHPPGSGVTGLIQYSIVMVEGGNPPDVPGINYTLVRGIYDFFIPEDFKRRRRRSKFGLKTPISLVGKEYDPVEKAIIVSIKELR
jgi:small subunit ribosomal protein S12